MDTIRQSIIERRDRLGWSNIILAEKSNVPLIVIQRYLEGSFCLSGYLSQINTSLDEALQSKFTLEKEQNIETTMKLVTPINENVLINRKPRKRRCEWALHYNQCIKCGSSDKSHVSRVFAKVATTKTLKEGIKITKESKIMVGQANY
jgi:hypothetical protein